jgi:hypothetical protein
MTEANHIVRFNEPLEIDGVEVEEQHAIMVEDMGDLWKITTDREELTVKKELVETIEEA